MNRLVDTYDGDKWHLTLWDDPPQVDVHNCLVNKIGYRVFTKLEDAKEYFDKQVRSVKANE